MTTGVRSPRRFFPEIIQLSRQTKRKRAADTQRGTDAPNAQAGTTGAAEARQRAVPPYADIVALARTTTSKAQYLREVLRYVTRLFSSPYAAIHLRYSSEVVQDDFHCGPTDPQFWKAGLQEFLTDSLGQRRPQLKVLRARNGSTAVAFVSAPIFDQGGSTVGSLALVLQPARRADLPYRIATLEAITGMASACTAFLETASVDRESGEQGSGGGASYAALARLGHVTSPAALAFALTNELRNKFDFEQVALGLAGRNRVRVLSVSGLDHVNHRGPGVQRLVGAMEECLDAQEPIAYPSGDPLSPDHDGREYRLHRQWHHATNGDAVATIPLRPGQAGDAIVAVLGLRRRADRPFTREHIDAIRTRVERYAPALVLARLASRSLVGHVGDSCRRVIQSLVGPGCYGRQGLAAGLLLMVAWFFLGTLPYRPSVACRVTPAHVRHLVAPVEGVLTSAYVIEGDVVTAGQVLCEFDRRDVEQQIAALRAEFDVLDREYDAAMAAGKPVEVQLAGAKRRLVQARLDVAQRRMERATVVAPFDGLVVAGDLRQIVGSVLSKGHPLYQIAPPASWRLELEVPQAIVSDISADLDGVFLSYARPDQHYPFRVARVLGLTTLTTGKAVYVAEADLPSPARWLRPGMEGTAKLHFERRPAWWVALHGVIDYMHMRFWL